MWSNPTPFLCYTILPRILYTNEQFYHQLVLKWTRPASLFRIGYARVRGEVIRHPPAPIFIPWHKHSWPSVYSNIVFSDLPITNKTCNGRKAAFMATPYSIIRICSLGTIGMEITAHERVASLPIRIKISPVYWSFLKETEINLPDIMNQFSPSGKVPCRFVAHEL